MSRRRSMLPQRSLTRLEGLRDANADKTTSAVKTKMTSMLPPTSIGRPHTVRQPAMADRIVRSGSATARRPSNDKEPKPQPPVISRDPNDPFQIPVKARTSSRGSIVPISDKDSLHCRSFSHHLERTVPLAPSSSLVPPQRQSSMKDQRPAFSVMQQHNIPKKPVGRSTSSFPSEPASVYEIPSAEAFPAQIELTQLHVLHRSALPVQLQWEESAKGSFKHRFDTLYERHMELKDISHQQQILLNQLALIGWSEGKSGLQIAEKVQLFSRNISYTCNLLAPEGKYTRILEVFKSWFDQALRVRDQREPTTKDLGKRLDFIEGIGDGWKAEAMVRTFQGEVL